MKFSSWAVFLLSLVVCLTQLQPINGNAETDSETQGSTVRPAEESSRQHSGRHWITSLRGPYQKIVSSGDSGISRFAENDDITEQDRKQHLIHRQSQEAKADNSSSFIRNSTHNSSNVSTQRVLNSATKLETVRNRNHRDFSSSRRNPNYNSTESTVQSAVASNKKRRRLSHYNMATSTITPQTMPYSLYNYFRPLEQDLPEDDILPFLDFGKKLSPSLPTPSGINSIENKSTGTRLKPKELHSTSTSNSTPVDEDVLPEDMDVTVVKKAVERNSAPRTPIQTHAPGISNYYRRKHPPTSRTADNLVITPDCPTPTPGYNNTKNSQSIKKMNRQHYRQVETESGESKCDMSNPEKTKEMQNTSSNLMSGKSIEVQKDRLQQGGTHTESYTASPVAAESSLVSSVKQIEAPQILNSNTTNEIAINITDDLKLYSTVVTDGYDKVENVSAAQRINKTDSNVSIAVQRGNTKTISATATSSPNSQLTTRILSTAVVTSVSLKESSFNNSVTGTPSPQLSTQARLVNSTIDRTDYTSEADSGTQSTGNFSFLEKVTPTEKLNHSSHSLVTKKNGEVSSSNFTSTERMFPIGSVQTASRSNRSSAVEKTDKQLTVNFTSSERAIPIEPLQANHMSVAEKSGKHLTVNFTSSERVISIEPLQVNHTSVAEKSGKQLTVNFKSSERVIPIEPLQANHTSVAEKNGKQLTINFTSSEIVIPIKPLQANHTSVADKSGKQLTVNLTSSERGIFIEQLQANHTSVVEKSGKQLTGNFTSSERAVPTESSQPPGRSNRTSEIEKSDKNLTGSFTSSERVIPTELFLATNRSDRTFTVDKSGTALTDNFTSTGSVMSVESMQTSLTTNRNSNHGNDHNMNSDGSTDPLTGIETTTVSLSSTSVTNEFSQMNISKESSVTTNLPKTTAHEEYALDVDPGNSSTGDLNRSIEGVGKVTTDGSIYVNNNTIADLVATDVYYDYDEPGTLSEPETEDRNNMTKFVHKIPEDGSDEDSWLQNVINSTVIEQNVGVAYPQPTIESSTYILVGLSIIPILLGAAVAARFFLLRNKKKVLDESEYSSEYNRSPLSISNASPLPTKLPRVPQHLGWEMEKSPPSAPSSLPSSKWEFPREKLRLQTVLGQGNFGQVWKAEADDISGHEGLTRLVAVKTVKESASAREREDLLRELGIMQDLGSHPNVVTLLGCCTEKEPYYLIMEYVMYGKLLTFLRDHRTRAHYYNFSDVTDALTSRDLTVFIYCVARGMDYLTNKGIIHRDLAARNVLVDHNKLCKIADFGMSRNVRDTGQIYEQRQSKGALPIRWMAPESLHYSLFTHKSDVWSFGILMWEIVTLGSTPYATMGAREVMRRVRDGYRLERPNHCRPELFRVISRCWHADPSKRPNFAELKHEIGQLLSDTEHGGNYIDLDSLHEEMKQSSQGSTLQRNQ